MSSAWPIRLTEGRVGLRPLRRNDRRRWIELRRNNTDWLAQWEATVPEVSGEEPPSFFAMVRRLHREAREGHTMPLVITYDNEVVGQLTVGGIAWGSLRSCFIGYWIDRGHAGRGITPTAVAMVTDYMFERVRLHRVEINIRPENVASKRVVEKLGFREEGVRTRYLHIDGDWRDHISYVLTAEEVPDGVLRRWMASRSTTT
jgi:ribosomal-protein-alanine N-acetyltransferase